MNTSKVIHQAKLNSWANTIHDQQESSLSVSKWCDTHQISKTQFYYWKRQLADQFVESQLPDIVPISAPVPEPCCTTFKSHTTNETLPELPTLKISIGDVTLEVNDNTSSHLISKVIKAVRHA